METEEIEKAAQLESDNLTMYASKWDFKRGFHKGVEFSDKHWQEKTRWKSLETEPPKEPKPFEEVYLLLKDSNGSYVIKLSVSQNSINYWLKEGFTEWKEIE